MRLTALTIASVEPWTSASTTIGNSIIFDDSVGEHVLEADRRRGGALRVEQALAIDRDFAGAGFILDHGQRIARRRHGGEAEHFDREGRAGFLDLLAIAVGQRADLARGRAGDEHVADLERAALDEHGGDRAAALVELAPRPRSLRRRGRDWPSVRAFRPGSGSPRASRRGWSSPWPTLRRPGRRRSCPRR